MIFIDVVSMMQRTRQYVFSVCADAKLLTAHGSHGWSLNGATHRAICFLIYDRETHLFSNNIANVGADSHEIAVYVCKW